MAVIFCLKTTISAGNGSGVIWCAGINSKFSDVNDILHPLSLERSL